MSTRCSATAPKRYASTRVVASCLPPSSVPIPRKRRRRSTWSYWERRDFSETLCRSLAHKQGIERQGSGLNYIELSGLRIAYERVGTGPPLLLLHGAFLDIRGCGPKLTDLSPQFT